MACRYVTMCQNGDALNTVVFGLVFPLNQPNKLYPYQQRIHLHPRLDMWKWGTTLILMESTRAGRLGRDDRLSDCNRFLAESLDLWLQLSHALPVQVCARQLDHASRHTS